MVGSVMASGIDSSLDSAQPHVYSATVPSGISHSSFKDVVKNAASTHFPPSVSFMVQEALAISL
jgi:hypothetical protein